MKRCFVAALAALLAVLAAAQSQGQSCLEAQSITIGGTETTNNKDLPKSLVRLNYARYEIQGL